MFAFSTSSPHAFCSLRNINRYLYLAGEGCGGGGWAGHGAAPGARGCGELRRHAAPGWTRKRAARPSSSAWTARSRPPTPGTPGQGQAQGTAQRLQHPWGRNLQLSGYCGPSVGKPQAVVPAPRAQECRSAFLAASTQQASLFTKQRLGGPGNAPPPRGRQPRGNYNLH